MMENKYFTLEPDASTKMLYTLQLHHELLPEFKEWNGVDESWNVLPARLLGLSYSDYLTLLKQKFKACIIDTKTYYPKPLFKYNRETVQLVRFLNKKIELIKWEKNNPDWQKHQFELIDKKLKQKPVNKQLQDYLKERYKNNESNS